jgi:hypothetical protein
MTQTSKTPAQIDTELAAIYRETMTLRGTLRRATDSLHRVAGHTPRYDSKRNCHWTETEAETAAAVRATVEAPDFDAVHHYQTAPVLARYDKLTAELAAAEAAAAPLNAEWDRRGGWSRFFTVQTSNGHIHSSMQCSTCNRGVYGTSFTWNPAMSGQSEAEALAALGKQGHILCTVCFPNAPVQTTPASTHCAGSAQKAVDLRPWARGTYGTCAACGSRQSVNANGTPRRHKPESK